MTVSDDIIVSAHGLVKRFGNFTAVDGIDLDICRGEIFGFLGPNGAGKTTTMRMVTTLTPPTEGWVEVCGHRLHGTSDPVKERIGIIQQHIALDRDVTVRENIRYHAILHHIPRKETDERIERLSAMMGLGPYMDKYVLNLSGGWKRRVAIVCAIIHEPDILFLDEPTAGLDPQGRLDMMEMFARLRREQGLTVVLVTHQMDDVANYADHVIVMDQGRVVKTGTPQEIFKDPQWLVEHQLGLPKTTAFAQQLMAKGLQFDPIPLTEDQLAAALVAQLPATVFGGAESHDE